MTRPIESEANCPSCKKTWQQTVYSTVNVTLDPELKKRVLSGDIFKFKCPHCGHLGHGQYDCLYHDMQKVMMISLVGGDAAVIEKKKAALKEGLAELPHRDLYCLRIVTSVQDLWEKIFIFDASLNDGIVELLKVILPSQNPELKGAMLRFHALDDVGALAFAVVRPQRNVEFISVPRDYYDAVRTKAFADLEQLTVVPGEWLRVDFDMVGQYMMSKQQA